MVAYGKTATCCVRATQADLEAHPERFNCQTCEFRKRTDGLYAANAEAWRIYQLLCGKTVRTCEVYGRALDWVTAGWSAEERVALLQRLDVILDVTSPDDDGRETAENRRHC